MRAWLRRFAHLVRRSREAADLLEEMEAHRALRQAQLERGGMAPAEAARESRRALGNVTLAREDARELWIVGWIDTLRQDVRNGFRVLVKYRGGTATAVIRTAGQPEALSGSIRSALADVARDQPIPDVKALDEDVAAVLTPSRNATVIFGVFAGLATLLAAVGIYGVMSHGVNVRRREIGIRMALGAERGDVMRLIMRRVILLAASGLAIGVGGALILARMVAGTVSGLLSGVSTTDAFTYAAVSVLMAVVALLAGWIPTRRAVRVAPTIALRCE